MTVCSSLILTDWGLDMVGVAVCNWNAREDLSSLARKSFRIQL